MTEQMKLWISVLTFILFALLVGMLCSYEARYVIIEDKVHSTDWLETLKHLSEMVDSYGKAQRISILLAVHCAQLYLALPMLHLTKILYGWDLGLLPGWTLCVVWETLLTYVYICFKRVNRDLVFVRYFQGQRQSGNLFVTNALLAMSSFPLFLSSMVVYAGGVSQWEFMSASTFVSAFHTLFNVGCGHLLNSAASTQIISIFTVCITLSTVLPTAVSVYLTSHGLIVLLRTYQDPPRERLLNSFSEPSDVQDGLDICDLCIRERDFAAETVRIHDEGP